MGRTDDDDYRWAIEEALYQAVLSIAASTNRSSDMLLIDEHIEIMADMRTVLEDELAGAVKHAREGTFGPCISWEAIASALGVTKQAAHKRYR